MEKIADGVETTSGNLAVLQADARLLAIDIAAVTASLDDTVITLGTYREMINELTDKVNSLDQKKSKVIRNAYLLVTCFLVVFTIVLLGTYYQGIMLTRA